MNFLKNGETLIPVSGISKVDYSRIQELVLVVYHGEHTTTIEGIDALESAMVLRPSVVEGQRLLWDRGVWFVHNMFGHPLMQIFALFGWYELAFKVHDKTVPKPRRRKPPRKAHRW